MKTVAYLSPFVPPEWIAAHGLRPRWLRLRRAESASGGTHRGVCPCAAALVEQVRGSADLAGVVLTTICDQMRFAAACLESAGDTSVFLLNVPSTWQSVASGRLFGDEIRRLGQFLVSVGGREPSAEELVGVLRRYDEARRRLRERCPVVSARDHAAMLDAMNDRRPGHDPADSPKESHGRNDDCLESPGHDPAYEGIPLALVGGPLLEEDLAVLDMVARAGGRIVLDASQGGERTLPAAFNPRRLVEDPIDELTRAYFGTIPDVFRRPNTELFDWLGRRLVESGARGLLFWRHVFCDLWHAELHRLREWSPVPVLDLDSTDGLSGSPARTLGRIESFLEMLAP